MSIVLRRGLEVSKKVAVRHLAEYHSFLKSNTGSLEREEASKMRGIMAKLRADLSKIDGYLEKWNEKIETLSEDLKEEEEQRWEAWIDDSCNEAIREVLLSAVVNIAYMLEQGKVIDSERIKNELVACIEKFRLEQRDSANVCEKPRDQEAKQIEELFRAESETVLDVKKELLDHEKGRELSGRLEGKTFE